MSEDRAVHVTNNEVEHRFEAAIDDAIALAEYSRHNNTIIFTHTEVPPSARGRGVAKALARTALDYARAHSLQVVPKCPFFARYIEQHPEYQDLLRP